MIPSEYDFCNTVKVISGKKAIDQLSYELGQRGSQKPIIITDQEVATAGMIKTIIGSFGGSDMIIGAVYDDTPHDVSDVVVNEIAAIYRDRRCDAIIAVGSDSVIDTAKGVNIAVSEDTNDLSKFAGNNMLNKPMKPFIAIPTTAIASTRVTKDVVLNNQGAGGKVEIVSPYLLPDIAVVDLRLLPQTMPGIIAENGIAALSRAIEICISQKRNPVSDAIAHTAIQMICENLIDAVKDVENKNKDLGAAMINASMLATIASTDAMGGLVHALAQATKDVCNVSMGNTTAALLPVVMEFNCEKVEAGLSKLLLPLAGPEEYAGTSADLRAQQSITTVKNLITELQRLSGLPVTLKEAGVPEDKLEEIAKKAIDDKSIELNPEPVDLNQVLEIIKKAH